MFKLAKNLGLNFRKSKNNFSTLSKFFYHKNVIFFLPLYGLCPTQSGYGAMQEGGYWSVICIVGSNPNSLRF